MNLELDFTPYYKLTLPISKKTVTYRPYLVGEEITFITHVETKEVKDLIYSLIELTKNCVKEPDVFDNMNLIDFTYLAANIRGKSKGETVSLKKKCPKCEIEMIGDFDVSKDLKVNNLDNAKLIVPISDDVKLEIRVLPYTHLIDMLNLSDEAILELVTVASCISTVINKGKIIKDFTLDDVYQNIVTKLSSKQLKLLVDEMKKLPTIVGHVDFKCHCGYEDKYEVNNILNFLS